MLNVVENWKANLFSPFTSCMCFMFVGIINSLPICGIWGGGVVSADGRLIFFSVVPAKRCDIFLVWEGFCDGWCWFCIRPPPLSHDEVRLGLVARELDGDDCWLNMGDEAWGGWSIRLGGAPAVCVGAWWYCRMAHDAAFGCVKIVAAPLLASGMMLEEIICGGSPSTIWCCKELPSLGGINCNWKNKNWIKFINWIVLKSIVFVI